MLNAIASPRRREILRLVWTGEVSAGEISRRCLTSRSAPSRCSFAPSRKRVWSNRAPTGSSASIAPGATRSGQLAGMLESMWDDALWKLKLAAELEQTRRGPRPVATRASAPAVEIDKNVALFGPRKG